MCEPNDVYLISEFLCFGLTEKALFQEILGLILVYADMRERGRMSKSVYVRVVHDLELLRYVKRILMLIMNSAASL